MKINKTIFKFISLVLYAVIFGMYFMPVAIKNGQYSDNVYNYAFKNGMLISEYTFLVVITAFALTCLVLSFVFKNIGAGKAFGIISIVSLFACLFLIIFGGVFIGDLGIGSVSSIFVIGLNIVVSIVSEAIPNNN